MNRLEVRLAELCHRRGAVLTGSGTAALTLALRALCPDGGLVGLPANVCTSVPISVMLAGLKPHWLDISPSDHGLDPAALEACSAPLVAVIAVHSYGVPCRIEELALACGKRNIPLIEDCAVALGGTAGGRPLGSFGTVSVLSFGAGKIVDLDHGGALLSDDPDLLQEIRLAESRLAAFKPENKCLADDLSGRHTRLYNAHYPTGSLDGLSRFAEWFDALRDTFLWRFDPAMADAVRKGLDDLADNVARRADTARQLERLLAPAKPVLVPGPRPDNGVVWRFNCFLESGRDALLHRMLAQGLPVSSWFPPADLFFTPRSSSGVRCPVADRHGETILNLWVNHQADRKYLEAATRTILEFLDEPSTALRNS